MAWRKGHGKGAGVPRIEFLPPDELPDPIPDTRPDPAASVVRREDGTVADPASAKALGAKGGQARWRKAQSLRGLGLNKLVEADDFHPYWKVSEHYIKDKLMDLASQAGGYIGPGPTSMAVSAARYYAASLYYFDLASKMGGAASAALMLQSSRLAETSRIQNMAAYEMAVREAKARAESVTVHPYAGLLEASNASEDDSNDT